MKERIAKECFERANHDLEAAKILINKEGYYDVVLFHIHQAVEKYLKGFLISKGWQLRKIHDLETLITEASGFSPALQKYLDFGRKLTAFYYEQRYPPAPVSPYPKEETTNMLETACQIIDRLLKDSPPYCANHTC